MIEFLKTPDSPVCSAVAPVILQYSAAHAAADAIDESAVPQVIADLAVGEVAYNGGQIVNQGCKDLILTVTFLDGDDCEVCTADTITTVVEQLVVPANSSLELPAAYWQAATYVLSSDIIDGEPAQSVYFYSAWAPSCPTCVKLAV